MRSTGKLVMSIAGQRGKVKRFEGSRGSGIRCTMRSGNRNKKKRCGKNKSRAGADTPVFLKIPRKWGGTPCAEWKG